MSTDTHTSGGEAVATEQAKYRALMIGALEGRWLKLEDHREGFGAIVSGYELAAAREVGDDGKPTKRWSWMVKLTAEISETPEVYATGGAASEAGAKREASRRAREAQKARIAAAKATAPKTTAEKAKPKTQTKPKNTAPTVRAARKPAPERKKVTA
jgi:hypothetical protein